MRASPHLWCASTARRQTLSAGSATLRRCDPAHIHELVTGAMHEPSNEADPGNDDPLLCGADPRLRPGLATVPAGQHGAGDRHEAGPHDRRPAGTAEDAAEAKRAAAEACRVQKTGERAENPAAETAALYPRLHQPLTSPALSGLPVDAWIRFAVRLAIGFAVYALCSMHHSRIARQSARVSRALDQSPGVDDGRQCRFLISCTAALTRGIS